jgi:hypothetical protein
MTLLANLRTILMSFAEKAYAVGMNFLAEFFIAQAWLQTENCWWFHPSIGALNQTRTRLKSISAPIPTLRRKLRALAE